MQLGLEFRIRWGLAFQGWQGTRKSRETGFTSAIQGNTALKAEVLGGNSALGFVRVGFREYAV